MTAISGHSAARSIATVVAALLAAFVLAAARPTAEVDSDTARPVSSLAGKMLVASPAMSDPRFRQSVILMVDHNAQGAFGLIVNKPLGEVEAAKLFESMGLENNGKVGHLTVFFGGPVQPEFGFVIHGSDFTAPDTRKVTDKLFVSPEAAVMAAMAQDKGPRQVVVVVGYAGWGPGQLEREMRQDAWFTAPPDAGLIFDTHHETKWKRAVELRYRSL